MRIRFLGATGQVTGSNYHVEVNDHTFAVDCGLYQGTTFEEKQNREPFQYNPSDLDFLILTHAHIDHSGRIPLLVKEGFRGRIYCTRPTAELANILLQDSGKISEAEAEWENKKRERAGLEKVRPLYTQDDALEALAYLNPVDYDTWIEIGHDLLIQFKDAGHLLGSAFIEVRLKENGKWRQAVFSGDLGTGSNPLLPPPIRPEKADILIVESTYGNRLHKDMELRGQRLGEAILKTVRRGGTVIIPAFAVGRTQEVLYELKNFMATHPDGHELTSIPIYIDSPLAIDATAIFKHNYAYLKPTIVEQFESGNNPIGFSNLHIVRDMSYSIMLNKDTKAKVVVSASGMCDAGRIKHHLKHQLWKDNNTVIFIGYQGEGTLGRAIKTGKSPVVILGETVKIASDVVDIPGFSGHADAGQLIDWCRGIKETPKHVFIIHGEPDASKALQEKMSHDLRWEATIPKADEMVEI